jgi:hypothetical protein
MKHKKKYDKIVQKMLNTKEKEREQERQHLSQIELELS